MGLCMYALPKRFRRSPEADNQSMPFQADQVVAIRRKSAAGRNHGLLHLREFGHNLLFDTAKYLLSSLSENFRNAARGSRFDQLICIHEPEMQMCGHDASDRRLPRSHKTDQGQIVDCARSIHRAQFIRKSALRTWIFALWRSKTSSTLDQAALFLNPWQ